MNGQSITRYATKYKRSIIEGFLVELDGEAGRELVIVNLPFYGYTAASAEIRQLCHDAGAREVKWGDISRQRKLYKQARQADEETPIWVRGLKDKLGIA